MDSLFIRQIAEDSANWLAILGQIITVVVSLAAIFIAIFKAPAEIGASNSTSAKAYADVAMSYAEEVKKLRIELDEARKNCDSKIKQIENHRDEEVEKEIEDLQLKLTVMQQQVTELLISKNRIENWAIKLVKQVESLGGTPVPLDDKI